MVRKRRNTGRLRDIPLSMHPFRPTSMLFGPSEEVFDPYVGGEFYSRVKTISSGLRVRRSRRRRKKKVRRDEDLGVNAGDADDS